MGKLLINIKTILAQPTSRSNWFKKFCAWPLLMFLALPVYLLAFCFMFLPLLMGSGILYSQVYAYLQDGNWYEISVLDAATQTVDQKLTTRLREPLLSTCSGAPEVQHSPRRSMAGLVPDSDAEVRKHPKASCLITNAWISWLDEPTSWVGVHKLLVPAMSALSIPAVLFGFSLFTGYFCSKFRDALIPRSQPANSAVRK